ncbi:MAG: hypothetical protein EHM28_03045 [Spirochaetaceae bacterium]|nr:MAG: hypothetical protein EHM28_03045 [Spirochaetaceae bacterium]
MKKYMLISIILVLIPAVLFAASEFQLVYQGDSVTKPVDPKKLEIAIKLSLANYGWRIVETAEGAITAKYEKSGGVVMALIKVSFSSEGFSVSYLDSKGLDVDMNAMTIHSNYVRWIRNLIKTIGINYSSM